MCFDVAVKLKLTPIPIVPFKVYVGSGAHLLWQYKGLNVPLQLHRQTFSIDFYLLDIKGVELVLGIQWLSTLGPVLTYFQTKTF